MPRKNRPTARSGRREYGPPPPAPVAPARPVDEEPCGCTPSHRYKCAEHWALMSGPARAEFLATRVSR